MTQEAVEPGEFQDWQLAASELGLAPQQARVIVLIAQGRLDKQIAAQMEISYGPFAAEVFIPFAIDADRVEANHEGGILEVILPKTAPRRISPRTVPVADQSPESGQETSK